MYDAAPGNQDTGSGDGASMSRRSVLRTTAGVAGAGLALGATGSGTASAAQSAAGADTVSRTAAPARKGGLRPGGHGGMHYLMVFRLMQCMRLGPVPDFDVYDAATWRLRFR